MGKKDLRSKAFFSNPRNFASICNGVLFGGNKKIKPSELTNIETEEYDADSGVQAYVDVVKKWNKNGASICILAFENQSSVDYGMVIRTMLKETLDYKKQYDNLKKWHSDNKNLKAAEYVSGVSKSDMLIPVITIVVYLGEDRWDGARQLTDMLDIDKSFRGYVNNFKLNIFDYHDYDNFMCFDEEVQKLFEVLSLQKDRQVLDAYFKEVDLFNLDTALLIEELLDCKNISSTAIITKEGAKVHMCKAFEEVAAEAEARGMEKGMEKGMEREIISLVNKGIISLTVGASELGITEEELAKKCK